MINKFFISTRNTALFIATLGTIWAFTVHTNNILFMPWADGMVHTADDPSYLAPAQNFAQYHAWKDNTFGSSSYMQRPPGMGILHFVFFQMSPSQYYVLHKLFHLLLHYISLYLFGITAINILGKKAGVLTHIIYALLPCFWGYLFYYITESITPSILVILMYGYIKHQNKPSPKWLVLQACLSGALLLIRPQLGFFLLPFFYFLWSYRREKKTIQWGVIVFSLVVAFGGFGLWQIRALSLAKHWVGIHPIYDVTNNTQYRPVHKSFGELFKIWEHDSKKFHEAMTLIWMNSLHNQEVFDVHRLLTGIPPGVFKYCEPEKMENILNDYARVCKEQQLMHVQNQALDGESEQEKALRLRVDSLTLVLKRKMWVENYITTPLHSAKFMFSKSQLNLSIFQITYRGQWWMESLRYLCLGLIGASSLLSLLQLFNVKNKTTFLLALAFISYLFYLFFIQKMNEERYLEPLLPLVLFLTAERIMAIFNRIKAQYKR